MHPVQEERLKKFGNYVIFMEAVHDTNEKGHLVLKLLVKDEFGRKCHIVHLIAKSEKHWVHLDSLPLLICIMVLLLEW